MKSGDSRLEAAWRSTYKDSLTHEREVFRPPEVAVVDASHEDVREEDADILVNLEPQRTEETVAADEVPVEAPREQAHALIVAGATKDVPEDRAVVVGETEDRDTGKEGEDPCMSHIC